MNLTQKHRKIEAYRRRGVKRHVVLTLVLADIATTLRAGRSGI